MQQRHILSTLILCLSVWSGILIIGGNTNNRILTVVVDPNSSTERGSNSSSSPITSILSSRFWKNGLVNDVSADSTVHNGPIIHAPTEVGSQMMEGSINADYENNNDDNPILEEIGEEALPLCMEKVGARKRRDFWGDNFNRIIQLSNLMGLRNTTRRKVALSPGWTSWFEDWFDPITDSQTGEEIFIFNRSPDMNCSMKILPGDLHFLRNFSGGNPSLVHRIPKLSIRQEADEIVRQFLMEQNASSFVSVHRRHIGMSIRGNPHCSTLKKEDFNWCLDKIEKMPQSGDDDMQNGRPTTLKKTIPANLTMDQMGSYCELTYETVLNDLRTHNQHTLPVLLFTDGKAEQFDSTFPYRDNHTLQIQSWMMTLSEVHYGNPLSSIDYTVNHWRRGRQTRPEECYAGYHSVVAPHVVD